MKSKIEDRSQVFYFINGIMKHVVSAVFLINFVSICVGAYTVSPRRAFLTKVAAGSLVAIAFKQEPVLALGNCPDGSNNCVRTTWSPPTGTSKADSISIIRKVINSYPQSGQENGNVDGGGWTMAVDELDSKGTARIEYRSSGKGVFAKLFNGGKPFVDDLRIEVEDSGVVQIRSQSRIGDSDFGVNAKRISFLASILQAQGWSV